MIKKAFPLIITAILLFLSACQNKLPEPIELNEYVIGDVNTIVIDRDYVQSYYAGLFMAVEEINKAGGVNGIPLKVETKSDYGSHREAYIKADYLVKEKNAIILSGTSFPQTTLGVARYAQENQVPFVATGTSIESIITGSHVSDYVFRLKEGYNLHMKALAEEIIKNKSMKSLVIVTYSSGEAVQNSEEFKRIIHASRPDIKFVQDVYLASQKGVFDSVSRDILYSFTTGVVILLDGPDIFDVMKDIQIKRASVGKSVYLMMGGEPEWIKSLLSLTPKDWVVTGFPWYSINTEQNKAFFTKYQNKYKKAKPVHSSYVGYITGYIIADALRISRPVKNDVKNRDRLAKAMGSASFNSPIGLIKMRSDHQSNMGTYIGLLKPYDAKVKGSKKVRPGIRMYDSVYVSADKLLVEPKVVNKIREKQIKNNKKLEKKSRVIPKKESSNVENN